MIWPRRGDRTQTYRGCVRLRTVSGSAMGSTVQARFLPLPRPALQLGAKDMSENRVAVPASADVSGKRTPSAGEKPHIRKIDCGSRDDEIRGSSTTRIARGPGVRRDS